MSCGVSRRRGSDAELLWLWHRLEATALIRPLAWEPPYAVGAALEMTKKDPQKNFFLNLKSTFQYSTLHCPFPIKYLVKIQKTD